MIKLYPLVILFLSFFYNNSVDAQLKKSIINTVEIGTLKCFYIRQETANKVSEYAVQVIYKNQQFIYKQEEDTIHLKSKEQIATLIGDLKSGLLVINDEDKELNMSNNNYTIFKNKGYSDNNFIVLANKNLSIKSPINKFFANQLISWLNSIDFGKG